MPFQEILQGGRGVDLTMTVPFGNFGNMVNGLKWILSVDTDTKTIRMEFCKGDNLQLYCHFDNVKRCVIEKTVSSFAKTMRIRHKVQGGQIQDITFPMNMDGYARLLDLISLYEEGGTGNYNWIPKLEDAQKWDFEGSEVHDPSLAVPPVRTQKAGASSMPPPTIPGGVHGTYQK